MVKWDAWLSQALQKEGCKVTMTLRNHHSRESVIPANCRVLNYDELHEKINQFRVVNMCNA